MGPGARLWRTGGVSNSLVSGVSNSTGWRVRVQTGSRAFILFSVLRGLLNKHALWEESAKMSGKSFSITADAPLSTLAIRKALKDLGSIAGCSSSGSKAFVSFDGEPDGDKITAIHSIKGVSVKICLSSPAAPPSCKGTIFCREFESWSLEEISEVFNKDALFIKRLPTKDRSGDTSGRLLLAFNADALPKVLNITELGRSLEVRPHIPMPLRCRTCLTYGHHEKNCDRPPPLQPLRQQGSLPCRMCKYSALPRLWSGPRNYIF